jgi:hypothetical protein
MPNKLTDDGRRRFVRHGHLPEREITSGIGPVAVRCPRVRDRGGESCERHPLSSAILPPYARRSKSLEVLISILYLKGISTGDAAYWKLARLLVSLAARSSCGSRVRSGGVTRTRGMHSCLMRRTFSGSTCGARSRR